MPFFFKHINITVFSVNEDLKRAAPRSVDVDGLDPASLTTTPKFLNAT